jgi:hypothetical protein
MMVTQDGRGAVAFAPRGKEAVTVCCQALGLDPRSIMGATQND